MYAHEIIDYIKESKKTTNVKVYLKLKERILFPACFCFGYPDMMVIGDYKIIRRIIEENKDLILDMYIEENSIAAGILAVSIKYKYNQSIEKNTIYS